MKRVYTDDRFPGCELVNDGSCIFEVRKNGRTVTTFETWEKPGGKISEAFAQRRAIDFFERTAIDNDPVSLAEVLQHVPADRDATDIVNAPPSAQHNSKVIDRMLAREKTETDPAVKRRLRHNILHLMKQEETVAEAVVSHLIEN